MKINPISRIAYNNSGVTLVNKPKGDLSINGRSINELSSFHYKPISFTSKNSLLESLWKDIKYNNSQEWIRSGKEFFIKETLVTNQDSLSKIKLVTDQIESMGLQNEFVDFYCKETGFPDLSKVAENMNKEFLKGANELANITKQKLLFVGYDNNCSAAKGMAFPGSDFDGAFVIYDDCRFHTDFDNYYRNLRWALKDFINQRLVSTPVGHLPEVFEVSDISKGFDFADKAFVTLSRELQSQDYVRFKQNLSNDGKDYVKAAEFNIRLSKFVPQEARNHVCPRKLRDTERERGFRVAL